MRQYWNEGWEFTEVFSQELFLPDCSITTPVRLPHTTKEVPLHYFDEGEYQLLCGYRRVFRADPEWQGKALLLTLEGVGHACEIFLNGHLLGSHQCGYTAVTVDLSKEISFEAENILVVKVDSRETLNQPPFGFVVDYMTFGGIYRDVYLEVREKSHLQDVFVQTKVNTQESTAVLLTENTVELPTEGMQLRRSLREWNGEEKKSFFTLGEPYTLKAGEKTCRITDDPGEIALWSVETPRLYELKTELIGQDGRVLDEKLVRFGFREAVFRQDGFYLNGNKVKLRGLNRHQSYPYVGYAMPESMQRLDADILKFELGLNAVRTSHYPQSHDFLDRCDELGLLVFTEFPGWQHIGDEAWKDQAVQNVRDMVLQYRNHTSIILWGVRINESVDDDAFYTRTNTEARLLDPTRQTGGVRCYKKGSLLEDVFTYNDFSHEGSNSGCESKKAVTSDVSKPYLISEYNGHMFPTKAFDWEEKRCEHAIRHARVLDSVAAETDIAGAFGWCMFDYNTHRDFGSGDRICYHGVMDMFRNPKQAAVVYAAQQEETPVLELSSSFDIGEHPGCNRGDVYIYTNADSVRMYKNNCLVKEYAGSDTPFSHLPHGPILIDDYIGNALEEQERLPHRQAEALKEVLNETARVGLYRMSKATMAKAGLIALRYHMKLSDAVTLFNRYVGNWGGTSTEYRFEAVKDGQVVKSRTIGPMTKVVLRAEIDHSNLTEGKSYDVALVRITARDEYGNLLPWFNDPVKLSVTGPACCIGPEIISLSGGMGGTYLRTLGQAGNGLLRIESTQGASTEVQFSVTVR